MIRMGIDPGSARIGVVVTTGDDAPLDLLYVTTYEVGEVVPLARPRTGVRENGTVWTQTTRRSVTGEHVDALVDRIMDDVDRYGVERVILEHIDTVYLETLPAKSHSSRATQIARSTWIEGELRRSLVHARISTEQVTVTSARARVVGRGSRGGSGAERIPAVVARGYANWPVSSDQHERDAAVLCLYDVTPGTGKPRARPPPPSAVRPGVVPVLPNGKPIWKVKPAPARVIRATPRPAPGPALPLPAKAPREMTAAEKRYAARARGGFREAGEV
jgi:hypothetical protein